MDSDRTLRKVRSDRGGDGMDAAAMSALYASDGEHGARPAQSLLLRRKQAVLSPLRVRGEKPAGATLVRARPPSKVASPPDDSGPRSQGSQGRASSRPPRCSPRGPRQSPSSAPPTASSALSHQRNGLACSPPAAAGEWAGQAAGAVSGPPVRAAAEARAPCSPPLDDAAAAAAAALPVPAGAAASRAAQPRPLASGALTAASEALPGAAWPASGSAVSSSAEHGPPAGSPSRPLHRPHLRPFPQSQSVASPSSCSSSPSSAPHLQPLPHGGLPRSPVRPSARGGASPQGRFRAEGSSPAAGPPSSTGPAAASGSAAALRSRLSALASSAAQQLSPQSPSLSPAGGTALLAASATADCRPRLRHQPLHTAGAGSAAGGLAPSSVRPSPLACPSPSQRVLASPTSTLDTPAGSLPSCRSQAQSPAAAPLAAPTPTSSFAGQRAAGAGAEGAPAALRLLPRHGSSPLKGALPDVGSPHSVPPTPPVPGSQRRRPYPRSSSLDALGGAQGPEGSGGSHSPSHSFSSSAFAPSSSSFASSVSLSSSISSSCPMIATDPALAIRRPAASPSSQPVALGPPLLPASPARTAAEEPRGASAHRRLSSVDLTARRPRQGATAGRAALSPAADVAQRGGVHSGSTPLSATPTSHRYQLPLAGYALPGPDLAQLLQHPQGAVPSPAPSRPAGRGARRRDGAGSLGSQDLQLPLEGEEEEEAQGQGQDWGAGAGREGQGAAAARGSGSAFPTSASEPGDAAGRAAEAGSAAPRSVRRQKPASTSFSGDVREALARVQGSCRPAEFVLRQPYSDVRKQFVMHSKKLGQGQFGVIRPCMELATAQVFACKSIAKSYIKTPEDAEDVRREVACLRRMRGHPAIITLRDTFEDAAEIHIITELCAGGDLFDRIAQRGRLPEASAARVAAALVEALLHCHLAGIMHRDIKPENILLTSAACDHSIKLVDFGVATFFRPGVPQTDVLGTPEYMAPEVLRQAYGPEADIWSAGVLLYVALCGVPPFWAASKRGVVRAILEREVSFRSAKWGAASEGSKDLLRRMLDKNPTTRITALEILDHPWIRQHLQ